MGLSWNEPWIHCSKVCWAVTTTTCHDAIPASHCCSHNRPHHIDSKLSLECSSTWLGSRHCWLRCNRSHPHLGRWASFHCFHKPLCRKISRFTSKSSGWNSGKHLLQICTPLHSSKPLSSTSLRINFLASPPGSTERCTCQTGFNGWKLQRWLVSRMNIFTCFLMSSLEWLVTPLSGLWILDAPGLSVALMFISRTGAMQHIFSIWLPCNFHPPCSSPTSRTCARGLSWTSCPSASQTKPRPNRHAMKLFGQQKDALSSHSGKSHNMRLESFLLTNEWWTRSYASDAYICQKKRIKEYANDVSSNCSPRA